MKKFSWIDVVIIILFLLSVYLILTRIFGESASDLTIIVSLFSFLGGLIFKLVFLVSESNREFGEFKIKTIHSFTAVKHDFDNIKESIELIKRKLKI